MEDNSIRVYKYRWIVLLVFSLLNAVIQMQWLTFAPIATMAQSVYKVSSLKIDFLSMLFMIVFIIMCIPASYIIDTYGIRIGIGIGAVLTGVFGLMKGICANNYIAVCIAQSGLSIAQPFIINATTKVAVNWFPIDERATQTGIVSLSQYLGIIFSLIATPFLVKEELIGSIKIYNIKPMLMIYGVISVISALLLLVFLKEKPPTPPSKESSEKRLKTFEGLGYIFKQKDMVIFLIIFFIGLGMFNAISTDIDQICKLIKLNAEETGMVGGIMLIGGIVGACILPLLSDKYRKRKLLLTISLICMTPGLIGLLLSRNYLSMLVSSFIFGFFLMGAGPIGFQYGAELSYPAPESTSQGLILLAGQVSGIILVLGINLIGISISMVIFILLGFIDVIFSVIIKESPMILADKKES